MTEVEKLRLKFAKQERCALPCACYRQPHKGSCQDKAEKAIEAALMDVGKWPSRLTTPNTTW